MSFSDQIINWYEQNPRPLPWKSSRDPYKIWLSEIILQQTRVEQGTPYYIRFVEKYPSVKDLATAPLDDILKLWEGLGYYSRARNMHAAAQTIVNKHDGQFPKTYKYILSLKGVGPYTAAAISSFAFKLPYAAVDGNAIRVISRYFGIMEAVDDRIVLKDIHQKAQSLLSKEHPDKFNQAVMNLGAIVCTPKRTKCHHCPLSDSCIAYNKDLVEIIPVKSQKIKRRNRYFNYFVFRFPDQTTIIQQRIEKDIWLGLYEFPLLESADSKILSKREMQTFLRTIYSVTDFDYTLSEEVLIQKLTHQTIHSRFYNIHISYTLNISKAQKIVPLCLLYQYAMPKSLRDFTRNQIDL